MTDSELDKLFEKAINKIVKQPMAEQQHPITPPPELMRQWLEDSPEDDEFGISEYIATQAARWGADQELEACCEWLRWQTPLAHCALIPLLRAARRPKPPSLKELALEALEHILRHSSSELGANTIRRALEQLPND